MRERKQSFVTKKSNRVRWRAVKVNDPQLVNVVEGLVKETKDFLWRKLHREHSLTSRTSESCQQWSIIAANERHWRVGTPHEGRKIPAVMSRTWNGNKSDFYDLFTAAIEIKSEITSDGNKITNRYSSESSPTTFSSPPSLHFFFLFTRKSSNNCAIFQFFSFLRREAEEIEPKPKRNWRCPRCERSFQVLESCSLTALLCICFNFSWCLSPYDDRIRIKREILPKISTRISDSSKVKEQRRREILQRKFRRG